MTRRAQRLPGGGHGLTIGACLALTWAALCAASFAACSPANVMGVVGTGGAPAGDPAAVAKACDAYAQAYCGHLASCSPTATGLAFGTGATCEAVTGAACLNQGTAPGSGWTVPRTAGCTQAIPSWACGDFVFGANPPPECQTPAGTLPSGSPCGVDAQCVSAYCGGLAASACGTCEAPPAPGDSCASNLCPLGLVCSGSPPRCSASVASGAACTASQTCAVGLSCLSGTCTPGVMSADAGCVFKGPGCDPYVAGLSCSASSSACVTLQLAGAGEACGMVVDQQVGCVAGSCPRGVCVPFVAPGGACAIGGASCLAPARCDPTADGGTMGICQLPGAVACD